MAKIFGFNPSSWLNNVFFNKSQDGNYNYTLTNPNLGDILSVFNGGYSEANMMLLMQTVPELMFIVNAIASRVKNGIYKLVDKDGNVVEDNKLWNKILKGPNWQFSFDDFVWHAVAHRLITGNRYGYTYVPSTLKIKHANIQSLWLIPPHYTMIFMKTPRPSYLTTTSVQDYVDHYHYNGGDTMSDIAPEYITHDIYMKLGDSTDIVTGKGISPFKAGEMPLSNIVAVYKARNVIYVKRGPLGAIVAASKDSGGSVALTREEKEEVVNDLQSRFGLDGQQSPFAFTGQPITYAKFGSTIQELEPFKETEASCAALCAIIGIPSVLMPRGSDAKFMNLDIAERNLYENVIFSEGESICNFLTRLGHFDELGLHVEVSFDHVTCLQDDALAFAQAYNYKATASLNLFKSKIITLNELREDIGREFVDNGDNYIDEIEGMGQDSENVLLSGQAPPQPKPGTDPDANEEDDDIEDLPSSGKSWIKRGVIKLYKNKNHKRKFFNTHRNESK